MKKRRKNKTLKFLLISIFFSLCFLIFLIYLQSTRVVNKTIQLQKEITIVGIKNDKNIIKTEIIKKIENNIEENKKSKELTVEPEIQPEPEIENVPKAPEDKYYQIVKSIGNIDYYYINVVEEVLLTIPDNIIKSFINSGWQIYVTAEDIAEVYFNGQYSSVCAATFPDVKTIFVEDREVAVKTAVEHEIGHFLNVLNGKPCWSEEFVSIYYEEVESFKAQISNPGCVSNAEEFFAETFYYIIKDPSKCTPKALEFVKRYM